MKRMKLLLIVVDERKKEELEIFLSRFGIMGYTEISRALGAGMGAPRMGSRAFPSTSAVVFSILSDEVLEELRGSLDALCQECGDNLRMVAWDVDQVM